MKFELYTQQISKLLRQRNMLFPICVMLCVSQIITISLLYTKSERIVLVPPVIEKSMWVDSSGVSPSYLEHIGLFIGSLMLTKSAVSADRQGELLLKYVLPEFEQEFRNHLIFETQKMKKDNSSYVFFPQNVYVNPSLLTTTLSGELVSYVSEKIVERERRIYQLQFVYHGGRLLLTGVTEKNSKEEGE